jgi:hypothetical protein
MLSVSSFNVARSQCFCGKVNALLRDVAALEVSFFVVLSIASETLTEMQLALFATKRRQPAIQPHRENPHA